jgi:hypothetical protein
MRSRINLSIAAILLLFVIASCDPHVPPSIEFKTGGNYTSADATVAPGTSITVGIIAKKKEDDMKTYNISYTFDGTSGTTTKETFKLSGSEEKNYEKDYTFTVRNQVGVEDWFFVITDRDGNIAKLKLKLTVN